MRLKYINKKVIRLVQESEEGIILSLLKCESHISITKALLKEERLIMPDINHQDGILAIFSEDYFVYYLHIRNQNVYITLYLNNKTEMSINLKLNLLHEEYQLISTEYSYALVDTFNNTYEIDDKLFIAGSSKIEGLMRGEDEPNVYLRIEYGDCVTFVEYKKSTSSYLLRTLYISIFYNKIDCGIEVLSNNRMKLHALSNATIVRSRLHKEKEIVIKAKKNATEFSPFLLMINKRSYLVEYINDREIRLSNAIRRELLLESVQFEPKKTPRGIQFKGIIAHKHKSFKVDSIVTKDGKKLADIYWKDDQQVSFFISNEKLMELSNVHNTLYAAYCARRMYALHLDEHKSIETPFLNVKNTKGYTYITRVNLANNYAITAIPKSPLYTRWNQFKIQLASRIAPFLKRFKNRNINLFFEKEANAANESGFITFENVKKHKEINSANKFVLDPTNEQYPSLKKKYGKDLLQRYSFKHYLYIFLSTNFISSELSNHVVSVRVYNKLLLDKIQQTPLYFLQHGIMFAKPVDNPMGLGFHKKNQSNNLIKSVISSDLEAGEFYKMGYNDEDMMKTGLPKLDVSCLNQDADKFVFMPTWRYWEEGSIVKGEIENTTYYKALMECIKAFEAAGILDRLLIVPHNKFGKYIEENFSDYKEIVCTDPTEALKRAVIFITDYSSAIYDATYRGAYPIFYWKEKEYLIEHYKAIPPVNEENAPGKIATNPEELIAIVFEAMETNYMIPEEVHTKYLKVNEFNDNKNTERVIQELMKENVL